MQEGHIEFMACTTYHQSKGLTSSVVHNEYEGRCFYYWLPSYCFIYNQEYNQGLHLCPPTWLTPALHLSGPTREPEQLQSEQGSQIDQAKPAL